MPHQLICVFCTVASYHGYLNLSDFGCIYCIEALLFFGIRSVSNFVSIDLGFKHTC